MKISLLNNEQLQSHYFFYDANGYADSVRKYDGAALTSVTKMNFGYDGILDDLKAYDVTGSQQQTYVRDPITRNASYTEWDYSQGADGSRESKRMMYSPHMVIAPRMR